MCGICGQYSIYNEKNVQLPELKRMCDLIAHRGPDDEGYYINGSIGFGFRRLSIIDLSLGHQPMTNSQESIWVVFNGEIYNYKALQKELIAKGYKFKTHCDTEVIVHGYSEWGADVLQHLNGMFGFALWDVIENRLLVARDPMGIKCVYYTINEGNLYFSSEIRPLIAVTQQNDLDPESLNLFLRYRYTPSPNTLFRHIKKLAPGSCIIASNNQVDVKRWETSKRLVGRQHSIQEAIEKTKQHYEEALERQLISDVPVGILLSGGLDSGLLLALMKKHGNDWGTYTVGFGNEYKDDELDDAQETARHFHVKNHSIQIDQKLFENNLSKIVQILEEPVASASVVGMYFVCERAKQDVKVLLMGQGPDELIGGYKRHLGIMYGDYWRKTPRLLRNSIRDIIYKFPTSESVRRSLDSLDESERLYRYMKVFSLMPSREINALFQDGLIQDPDEALVNCWQELIPQIEPFDELGGFQYLELRSSLPDELLMYADKISMAHSLEVRVPYLDLEVVRYVESLPSNYKIRYGQSKWLHKQVCKQYLPRHIMNRKKRGFAVNVVNQWYRQSMDQKVKSTIQDDTSCIYKYLKKEKVRALVKDHQMGMRDNHKIIYSLIVLEEWMRHYLH